MAQELPTLKGLPLPPPITARQQSRLVVRRTIITDPGETIAAIIHLAEAVLIIVVVIRVEIPEALDQIIITTDHPQTITGILEDHRLQGLPTVLPAAPPVVHQVVDQAEAAVVDQAEAEPEDANDAKTELN